MKPTQQDYLETEEYKFLRLCSIDFDQAKNSLNLIDGVEVEPIRLALVRDALISYARPFTSNRGKYKFGHKLSKNDYISGEHIGLHMQILAVRDQVVAHSDVKMKAGGIQLVGGNFLFSFRSFSDFYELHVLI